MEFQYLIICIGTTVITLVTSIIALIHIKRTKDKEKQESN